MFYTGGKITIPCAKCHFVHHFTKYLFRNNVKLLKKLHNRERNRIAYGTLYHFFERQLNELEQKYNKIN